MKPFTERLIQIAAVIAILFYGWNFAVSTVLTIIERNNQIQQLQMQMKSCEQKLAAGEKPLP